MQRKLRIVKTTKDGTVLLAVCERCNVQFAADPHVIGQIASVEDTKRHQYRNRCGFAVVAAIR